MEEVGILKRVAPNIDVSHETLRQALYVMQHASQEDLEKLRSGERAISSLYREVKRSMAVREVRERAERCSKRVYALLQFLKPPKESLLRISKYANANQAIYVVKKPLHEKVERAAEILKTRPDILIENTIEEEIRIVASLKREHIEALQGALDHQEDEES